jgi:hypothetical protein
LQAAVDATSDETKVTRSGGAAHDTNVSLTRVELITSAEERGFPDIPWLGLTGGEDAWRKFAQEATPIDVVAAAHRLIAMPR